VAGRLVAVFSISRGWGEPDAGEHLAVLVGVAFAASGIGIIARVPWWRQVIVGSALFSTVIFVLFYDGAAQHLDAKGAVAILINAAILAVVLVFRRASS